MFNQSHADEMEKITALADMTNSIRIIQKFDFVSSEDVVRTSDELKTILWSLQGVKRALKQFNEAVSSGDTDQIYRTSLGLDGARKNLLLKVNEWANQVLA